MQRGDRPAYSVQKLGDLQYEDFQTFTWAEVVERACQYAHFLRSLGLKPGDKVALKGYNGIEWVLLDYAILGCGMVSVPLFQNAHPDEVAFILQEAEVVCLFCDKKDPSLNVRQVSFSEVENQMRSFPKEFLWHASSPGDLATIIYTSGTLGQPKGVMHTLGNLSEAICRANSRAFIQAKDILLSYLPLSHVAERMLIEYGSLYTGAQVYFIDKVERITGALPRVRPTYFFAVPRIWDMIRFRLDKELRSNELLQQRLKIIPKFLRPMILGYFIRRKLGLDRVKACFSGAAKLSAEASRDLSRFGIRVHEAYGLTETLCVSTLSEIGRPVPGSCGQAYEGVEIKIADDGEICLRANFHFKGYFKHHELTAEVLEDGWFKTGDMGHVDSTGNLFITDRKKNLFKSSNGKYIAPLVGENLLKSHPALHEALVLGENQPFCVALVQLGPLAEVSDAELKSLLEAVNYRLAAHEQIKVLGVLADRWSVETGELTASLKVRRKVVLEKYRSEIQQLFDSRATIVRFQSAEFAEDLEKGKKRRAHSGF